MSIMPISEQMKIGFDLGGTSLKYGYGNHAGGLKYFNIIYHKKKSLKSLIKQFETAFCDITRQYNGKNFIENARPSSPFNADEQADLPLQADMLSFHSLCLATPGIVDTETGIILSSTPNLPFLKGINLKEILQNITRLPVFIENDANLMVLGEAFGCPSKSVLGITIGTGIGTGFVQDKTIFKGEFFEAMEAGHLTVIPKGRLCLCGKRGCLEAYCSAESIRKIVQEQIPKYLDLSINDLFVQDDHEIKKIIYHSLDLLAIGIANMIIMLDPGSVVIGGGVIEIQKFDFEYLKKQVLSNLSGEHANVMIKKAFYGNKAGVLGAILYQ